MLKGIVGFDGGGAWLQYHVLMALYRLAVNRWLYGIFCRFLARFFSPNTRVISDLGEGRQFHVALNDAYWTRFLLYGQDYEPEVRRLIDSASDASPLFCDLGANKGLWSVYASPSFEQVISVEASSDTFRALQENTETLTNVTLHKAAIHATSGETLTFLNTYQSHASARLSLSGDKGERDIAEQVKTISIDDLVPPGVQALIKLDVEGAETAAIDGAAQTIAEGSVLIYEDHGSDLDCIPSAHLLKIPKVRLYALENGFDRLSDVAAVRALKMDWYKGYNFVAAHEDSPLMATLTRAFANPGRPR